MNTLAITLGLHQPPTLQGKVSEYIDGKPKQYERWTVGTDGMTSGQRARKRILELADEWGEVDMTFLLTDDDLDISRKALQMHLAGLVAGGQLVRHAQDKPGAGRPVTWTRRIA
jgi:hypothetical protein